MTKGEDFSRKFCMKKSTKNLLFLTSAVIAGMHIYNRVVDSNAERKNALKVDNGHYYKWKEGNIFYTKTGTGEPILLIHDTDSGASGEEWAKVAARTSLPSNIQATCMYRLSQPL